MRYASPLVRGSCGVLIFLAVASTSLAQTAPPPSGSSRPETRIEELERRVRELEARLIELERGRGAGSTAPAKEAVSTEEAIATPLSSTPSVDERAVSQTGPISG